MGVGYNPKIVTSGLVLCLDASNTKSYPGSSTTWFDLSPSKLNFTVNASFINNQGLSTGASASSATTSLLDTDFHTILFMFKINSNVTYPNGYSGSWDKIFSFNAGGSDRTPGVWRYPGERRIHWRYDPSNSGVDFDSTASAGYPAPGIEFTIDKWYYMGVTKSGATATPHVNGVNFTSQTVSNPKTAGNTAITLFEYYSSSAIMNCIHVYNRALTTAEVQQNFNALRGRFGI